MEFAGGGRYGSQSSSRFLLLVDTKERRQQILVPSQYLTPPFFSFRHCSAASAGVAVSRAAKRDYTLSHVHSIALSDLAPRIWAVLKLQRPTNVTLYPSCRHARCSLIQRRKQTNSRGSPNGDAPVSPKIFLYHPAGDGRGRPFGHRRFFCGPIQHSSGKGTRKYCTTSGRNRGRCCTTYHLTQCLWKCGRGWTVMRSQGLLRRSYRRPSSRPALPLRLALRPQGRTWLSA
jgi:hypothetical protein